MGYDLRFLNVQSWWWDLFHVNHLISDCLFYFFWFSNRCHDCVHLRWLWKIWSYHFPALNMHEPCTWKLNNVTNCWMFNQLRCIHIYKHILIFGSFQATPINNATRWYVLLYTKWIAVHRNCYYWWCTFSFDYDSMSLLIHVFCNENNRMVDHSKIALDFFFEQNQCE